MAQKVISDMADVTAGQRAAMPRQRDAVRLAGESMFDVIAAAEFLRDTWLPNQPAGADHVRVRTALETGMFVTYARPFTQSQLHRLAPARGLTPEQRQLHEEILELRNSVYAHTDETPWREV